MINWARNPDEAPQCRPYCLLKEIIPDDILAQIDFTRVMTFDVVVSDDVLEDVCDRECSHNCLRKEYARREFDARFLEQQRSVDDYKYLLGERGIKLTHIEAFARWIIDGFAQKFDVAWRESERTGNKIDHLALYVNSERKLWQEAAQGDYKRNGKDVY